jgi:hypothetical protein
VDRRIVLPARIHDCGRLSPVFFIEVDEIQGISADGHRVMIITFYRDIPTGSLLLGWQRDSH